MQWREQPLPMCPYTRRLPVAIGQCARPVELPPLGASGLRTTVLRETVLRWCLNVSHGNDVRSQHCHRHVRSVTHHPGRLRAN